jgi:hypothetical protein
MQITKSDTLSPAYVRVDVATDAAAVAATAEHANAAVALTKINVE